MPTGVYPRSDEHKQKTRAAITGKVRSPETREKIRLACIGRTVSKETREKLSRAHIGKKHSEETREKISNAYLCKILKSHADDLKDDPDRLHTDFIKELIGVKKSLCDDIPD